MNESQKCSDQRIQVPEEIIQNDFICQQQVETLYRHLQGLLKYVLLQLLIFNTLLQGAQDREQK